MEFAAEVVAHTPFYVWLLLAYLVLQGVWALRPRTQPMARVFLVPLLFIASGVVPLLIGPRVGVGLLAAWVLAAALLGPVGFLTGPRMLAVDRRAGTVTRPGSCVPLLRNTTVFVLQYAIAAAVAVHADAGGGLATSSRAVSGATGGYFLGWAAAAWQQYRAAARS